MGAATAILEKIISEARQHKARRLSLETGSGDAFKPALWLYKKRGFENGVAFGVYEARALNEFLHLSLE